MKWIKRFYWKLVINDICLCRIGLSRLCCWLEESFFVKILSMTEIKLTVKETEKLLDKDPNKLIEL